ncbi:MAG: TonB-dependent receptor [Acidobacteriaceae bacterium]|jgi:Carboxypeptidase regulatory-like domain/TonB dependent receptor
MRSFLRGWIFVCILASAAVTFGQEATTSLRGVIADPSGSVVPGADVALSDQATGVNYHVASNGSGYYVFPAIQPAHYRITVRAQGFATEESSITLLVSQPVTLNFSLRVSSTTVTVNVNSGAEQLNLTDATEGNAVGTATIESLPMDERNPISLLTLQPGVLYIGQDPATADSRQGAVAGGRSDQSNITLDGLDDNDDVFGTAFTGILRSTLDSTEEFRVVTSNGTAEAGRSSGAQINLVTRSGTNQYHGALYEYYRPDNVVANSYFNKYSELAGGTPNDPQFYLVNTFGGAIGGPIKKDKLFYFFNYEGNRVGTHQVVGATVPTTSFMAGGLGYQDVNGNNDTLTASQVASLDMPCESNTFNGQPVCPNGPGANAAVLKYLAAEPTVAPTSNPILGDGLNSGAYFFTSPAPSTLNTSILKMDYDLNSKNRFFVRGNLQKDTTSAAEPLPGLPAGSFTDDNSKGLAAGYTWIPNSSLVDELRYGFIRQGFQVNGPGQSSFVSLYGLTQPVEYCDCGTLRHVPVNQITDTLNWTKGAHSLAFGGTWSGITNHFSTDSDSFDTASTNPLYDNEADLPAPGPANGNPAINSSFYTTSWANAWGNLMGVVPELTNVYNYQITSTTTGTALPDGAFVVRNYRSNEFEGFVQDNWHLRSNVNVILGVRYTNLQIPYETNGQQISPTINMDKWYRERETAALQSQIYEPLISLEPSGKANGMPGYWPKQKDNFAPRVGIVWAPDPRTAMRASFGMYYDHYGEALVNDFDEFGSAGLATALTDAPDVLGFESAPRFTGATSLPDIPLAASPTKQTFPYTPPPDGFQIYWGIDNVMKTPYSESFNVSFQHQFGGGFVFEQAYVGRLARHLLQQIDLAEPVDYVDPLGGGDYFAAAKILSKAVDAAPFGTFNGASQKVNNSVPAIPYFEHVFPSWKNTDYAGESATQAIFNNAWSPTRYYGGETLALAILDAFPVIYGYGSASQSTFWTDQFSSLYALSTMGNSSYNALQFTLRHPATHGLTVDFGYTFSKSLDLGSETERGNVFTNADDGYVDFGIQNTWNPKLNKAVSDFDTHSLFTADWIYAFPVGRGRAWLSDSNRITDAFIGGWQWAGLSRVTSGLPFTLLSQGYPTNYENPGWGIATQPIQTKKTFLGGVPYVMNPATVASINSGVFTGQGPIRYPYAGEAGERNYFRGDGYFDIDSSLTKSWNLTERAQLKFAAEAYNITNSNRFDVSPAGLNPQLTGSALGAYSSTLSTYRRMQFGLRMDF